MAPTDNLLCALPPVVRAFVQTHSLPAEAVRREGRVVLTLDQRWRVHLLPAPQQRVALQAELIAVPEVPDRRTDDALARLCRTAAALLKEHAATLCIDTRRQALVLQQLVPQAGDVGVLEQALGDFVNALSFWSHLCRAELNPDQGVRA
ncbi:CesT family type III secretion system chaperone [Diaphorobacter nitroreducens]|uniref:CesT family type III secretion system chaperone n=1 Tax=Diaphorobacter nitroreducens TaxID=164759 RepID=UPI0035AF9C83